MRDAARTSGAASFAACVATILELPLEAPTEAVRDDEDVVGAVEGIWVAATAGAAPNAVDSVRALAERGVSRQRR
jgi:hypothetical protein